MTGAIQPPVQDLSEPGTYLFGLDDALAGQRLNRFAATLKTAERRAAFAADELGVMRAAGLDDREIAMVSARDWDGLIRAGAHVQLLTFITAAVGQGLLDVGADQVGCTTPELIEALPRPVGGVPMGVRDT